MDTIDSCPVEEVKPDQFNIDLDNYTEESLSVGLRDFIRSDIIQNRLNTLYERKRLKRYFKEWRLKHK